MSEHPEHLESETPEDFGSKDVSVDLGDGNEEFALVETPEELPVLPLKNTVLYPSLISPLLVTTQSGGKEFLAISDTVAITSRSLVYACSGT